MIGKSGNSDDDIQCVADILMLRDGGGTIEEMAAKVRAVRERAYEGAALVCDEHRQWAEGQDNKAGLKEYFQGYGVGCKNSAHAIRALKEPSAT